MNLSVLFVVGALALATPLGFLTYDHFDNDASTASAASADAVVPGQLLLRFHHDGAPIGLSYEIARAEEDAFETAAVTLSEGDTVFEYTVDPSYEYWVSVESEDVQSEPLGITAGRFGGMTLQDFAECDALDVLFQTFARDGDSGIEAWGAACIPGPARHVGVLTSGPTVAFPFPTCPLECTVGYSFGGAGDMEFDVPEGAKSVEVLAHWDPESPMTETLDVWLTTPDAECGEGCWIAVASQTGSREVAFVHDAPAAGRYGLSAHFTMPAGASVRQDVWFEAVVHAS